MKVLVAVEDKLFGEAIADFVANHEWPQGSELRILHVVESLHIAPLSGYPSELSRSLNEERMRAGKSLVLQIGTKIRSKLPTISMKEEIVEGHPKDVIMNTAKEWPADLIVLGSHGKSGIGQFFLGSVSMSVLSAAPCSVMVVKLPAREKEAPAEPSDKEVLKSR